MRHCFSPFRHTFVLTLCVAATFLSSNVFAQAHRGISSDGRDFYIGYMPNVPIPNPPEGPGSITYENPYIFICSASDNNRYTVNFFDDAGNEIAGSSRALMRGQCVEIPIVQTSMTPSKPGETLEFKAAHITSTYPVSVAVYQEGSAAGGMYAAVPTAALGKSYVVSAYFDVTLQDNPTPAGFADSTSSEFMIIATQDNTHVVWTPNSTTLRGVTGYNSPSGDGKPHPQQLNMRRGQVFWVRSDPNDILNDLTGSTIVSDKPVAVLGGQEKGLLGDPAGLVSQWADCRDIMVEQMTPIDSWDSEYVGIPFLPAQYSAATGNGFGDLYRIVTDGANAGEMEVYSCSQGTPGCTPDSRQIGAYQNPPVDLQNIESPLDLIVGSTGPDGKRKKMYPLEYDYFQGDASTDERAYTAPNEMDLIGLSKMKNSTVFHVRANSKYNGAQYINVVTRRDSLMSGKILIMINGLPTTGTPLSQLPRMKTYNIPNHDELIGFTSHVGPGDYMIWGNTPLACYSYGRTENTIKLSPWGYAAPTGMLYGSGAGNAPRAEITPACDHWDIHAYERGANDQGIAGIMLLNDPNGTYATPGRVSYNTTLYPANPSFTPGDTGVTFQILINDTRKDGYAALYIQDRGGNDTVIDLYYTAPKVTVIYNGVNYDTSALVAFKDVTVGSTVCQTVTVHINGTGNASSILFSSPNYIHPDQRDSLHPFSESSTPSLSKMVTNGDSVILNICYTSADTNKHYDALAFAVGCLYDTVNVKGNGVTPIIIADDHDFQNVALGTTKCGTLQVRNIGNGILIITKDYLLHLNPAFTFQDDAKLPDTIKPGGTDIHKYNFCFTPAHTGPTSTRMDWGTNIGGIFVHQKKDTSLLVGYGIAPGLNWDRREQQFTVKCDNTDTVQVFLLNPSVGANGSDVTVTNVSIAGPDADEFTVVDNERHYLPLENKQWSLSRDDSIWVDIVFKRDPQKGYRQRSAWIVADGTGAAPGQLFADTIQFTGIVKHSDLAIVPPSYDFGAQDPGQQYTQTFVITNTGDTDFVFNSIDVTGSNFTILSGVKQGDRLAPGMSDTVIVQFSSPSTGGTAQGNFAFHDDECSQPTLAMKGASGSMLAVDDGADYHLNFICHNNTLTVGAENQGQRYWGVLDSVQIVNVLGSTDAPEFVFTDNNSSLIDLKGTSDPRLNIAPGDSATFNIKFTPTHSGVSNAQVIYYWTDTSKGRNIWIVHYQPLTGVGYNAKNTLSVVNPTANDYSATTAKSVTVPVALTSAFADTAQVYGAKFTIRYRRDVFQLPAAGVQIAMPGLSFVGGTPTNINDATDNNYDLIPVQVESATPITTSGPLVNINLQYMLAKDTLSEFQIKDLSFLDNTGAQTCWIASDTMPAQFFGLNVCGDKTLREFLRSGGQAIAGIKVAPNPVHHYAELNYEVKEAGTPVSIEVFNALGEKVQTIKQDEVHEKGLYMTTFDASELPSGMYTIRFGSPGADYTKSILVSK